MKPFPPAVLFSRDRSAVAALLLAGAALAPPALAQQDPEPDLPARAPRVVLPAAEQTVWMSNGHVTLAVAPQVGRVVHFGPSRQHNLLWLSDQAPPEGGYINHGGEKLWPTLQAMWPRVYGQKGAWPPDPEIDGPAWEVIEQTDRCLTMRSPVSPALGVRIDRRFCLAEDAPVVTIRNTLHRIEPSIYPVHAWTVAQVPHPDLVLMDVEAPIPMRDEPWVGFGKRDREAARVEMLGDGEALTWAFSRQRSGKVGTLGRWIAGVFGDLVWVQRTGFEPYAAYPDGSNVQTYADTRYAELELLSPMHHLREGERLSYEVRWELMPRGGRTADEIAEAIEAAG